MHRPNRAALSEMPVLQYVARIQDGAAGDAYGAEHLHHLVLRPLSGPFSNRLPQLIPVLRPRLLGRKARIDDEFGPADRGHKGVDHVSGRGVNVDVVVRTARGARIEVCRDVCSITAARDGVAHPVAP